MTGGAGFIGSHITARLLSIGHEVVCIDNIDDYYSKSLKEDNVALLSQDKKFSLIRGDILNKRLIDTAMKNIDYVFHNAAQAGVGASIKNPFKTNDVNVTGTLNVLDAARKNNVKKIINASSSSVYGKIADLPLREDYFTKPISPYGASKLCAEHYCDIYSATYGMDTVSLRYFTVFGPRMRPDLAISIFTHNALDGKDIEIFGDGNKTRDFTYIDNVVKANILAMQNGHGVYNIGSGEAITIQGLAEKIIRLTNSKSRIIYHSDKAGDMEHTLADVTKASNEIKYHPSINMADGINRYVSYVKGQRLLPVLNKECLPLSRSVTNV